MDKIDIVYIVGKGSKWANNELKYSLRSIDLFADNYRDIYIIGECPDFLQNVIHIPYDDKNESISKNILMKLLLACKYSEISENFIVFNDDYFITKKVNVNNYKYYHNKSLFNYTLTVGFNNWYKENLVNTYEYLTSLSNNVTEPLYWDIHYPIIYNKSKFVEIFSKLEIPNDKFCIKTIYCHILNIIGKFKEDNKIKEEISPLKFQQLTYKKHCISTGDKFLTDTLKKCIERFYPNKSKFEK